jgi:predicted nucleic acid-binding protein
MIVLDTSAIVALEDQRDRFHDEAVDALRELREPLVVPTGILAEVDHMLATRSPDGMLRVLDSFIDGSVLLDCGDVDPPRIRQLMERYVDLSLGLADAAVIACAERSGGSVLTFDRRDFDIVSAEVPLAVLPPRG